jgi:cell division transport system ATP-binding protein
MIIFDKVSKRYDSEASLALDNVSFKIEQGEFVYLIGQSGSGKSTILNLILRLERPNSGNINVLGSELNSLSSRAIPKYRQKLGVVFQDFKLLPKKTVFENVAFAMEILGKPKKLIVPQVEESLNSVGLLELKDRMPNEVSGGERQRIAIARAIVNKPKIILADEPTGNLDTTNGNSVIDTIEKLNLNDVTILMATHSESIVNKQKHRVIELVKGQLVRDENDALYTNTSYTGPTEPGPTELNPVEPGPVELEQVEQQEQAGENNAV